jgi:hypothetical protein
MHPWTMQQLADERDHDLIRAAARARASTEAQTARPVGSHPVTNRATRYLGELLIRTGWRLVGPQSPSSDVRARLALRGSGAVWVDPC